MSSVKLVPNAKLTKANNGQPVYVTAPAGNGKTYRVQVQSTVDVEIRPGLFASQNRVGFARFMTEDQANRFVTTAALTGYMLSGKVIYVDQLDAIIKENADYGKQYPYPMNFNGKPLELNVRLGIQEAAIKRGLCFTQSDRSIYRSKVYTEDVNAKDNILSADNTDEVNAFVAKLLSGTGDAAKQARIAELQKDIEAKNGTSAAIKAMKVELAQLED